MESFDRSLERAYSPQKPRKLEVSDLDRPEMKDLVQNLIEHTATKEKVMGAEIRANIRNSLLGVRQRLWENCPRLGELGFLAKVIDRVYPAYTMKEHFEGSMRSIKGVVEKGQAFGIEVDGKLVAISAYRKFGDNPDGREIYELTKGSTLPEFRGRHYGDMINQEIFREINGISPEALVTTVTANKDLKAKLTATGVFKEYSLLAPDFIAKLFREKVGDEGEVRRMEEKGSRIYLFDPKAGLKVK